MSIESAGVEVGQ